MITFLDIFNIIIYAILFYTISKQSKKANALNQLVASLAKEIDYFQTINFNLEADILFHNKKNVALQEDLDLLTSQLKDQTQTALLTQGEAKFKISELKNDLSNFKSQLEAQKTEHKLKLKESVSFARKDALKRSRSVMRGQASEHLAPYILKDTNPKDYRFMGNPIDYICFEGLSDLLDGETDEIASVHFIDIKTGKATLNKSQRKIRDAIKASRVKFSLINLDEKLAQNDLVVDESQIEKQKNN